MATDITTFDKSFLKKPIKLIVSDVDGTLVDTDKHVSDVTVQAMKEAMAEGITVAVASGRAFGEMGEVLHRLPEIEEYICSNGAVVVEQKNGESKVIFHQSFSNEEGLRLLDELLPFDILKRMAVRIFSARPMRWRNLPLIYRRIWFRS